MIVIIGGGVVGTSIAFHLARRGNSDVVLLERGRLGEGATAYATGGIRQQFTSEVNVQLVRDSVRFFENFAEHTGSPFDFRQHGYLFLLDNEKQLTAFTEAARMQRSYGVPTQLLTPDEIAAVNPKIRVDDLLGGAYCATDGSGSPADATAGFAKAARKLGVDVRQHTEVVAIEPGKAVRTKEDRIEAETVIIATGPQARATGRLAGVELPVGPHRRQAFAIAPLPWLRAELPLTVDLGSGAYVHPDSSGGVIGGNDRDVPEGTDTTVDWSLTEPLIRALTHRIPEMEDAEIVRGWAGLREMTPDDHGIVGPVTDGVWAAAGFSGHGFMQSPAIGEQIARWLLDGKPSIDLDRLRPSRFGDAELAAEGVRF
ncbi:NAD(P)/FAD-dependent oxidoreductase [Fodinicola acaciae]|uniref:NAD(P)/FAD-dependent oxidoreductase n=1 Tax=Fodinicola acaciae TaxID=2681555 RepID=UPI0013D59811|nr:FAD-binding oxidoreductase [Fodinicola acaciae]